MDGFEIGDTFFENSLHDREKKEQKRQRYYKLDNMVLSSYPHLQKLFEDRWKQENDSNDWNQNDDHINALIGHLKTKLKKIQKIQLSMIKTGRLDNWDICTVSLVLSNFGDDSYESVNEKVRVLTGLRNFCAHHPSKRLTEEVFSEKVEIFKKTLKALNVTDGEIHKMIDKAGITSSIFAFQASNELCRKAQECVKQNSFVEAIEFFDEAAKLPSLLRKHEGLVYEKRAECNIMFALYKKQEHNNMIEFGKYCDQAFLDAVRASKLHNSWEAHHLIAQCYQMKQDFDKAIEHYNKALAISPDKNHLRMQLNSCRALGASRSQKQMQIRVDPSKLSFTERFRNLKVEYGEKQSEEEFFAQIFKRAGIFLKNEDEQHLLNAMDWNIPRNENEAKELAKSENPGIIYNLGHCYLEGKGVDQNLSNAYELFLQAALMTPGSDSPGPSTTHHIGLNCGVANAQQALGLLFEHGIHVEQDYTVAIIWYDQATENGAKSAANRLGFLYSTGTGVTRDLKKAEKYWKQAVDLGHFQAANSLMCYYIRNFELEKAWGMFRKGKDLGHPGLKVISEEQFEFTIQSFVDHRVSHEREVIEFEKAINLLPEELTFLERWDRKIQSENPEIKTFVENLNKIISCKKFGGQIRRKNELDLNYWEELMRANPSSETAARLLETKKRNSELIALWNDYIQNDVLNSNQKKEILDLVYDCVILESNIVTYPKEVKLLLSQLLEEKCWEKSDEDMKTRICYARFNFDPESDQTYEIDLLKEGIQRYPDNVHYYELLATFYSIKGDHKSSLYWSEQGLKVVPSNVDLLFCKATQLRFLAPTNGNKMIEAYLEFIENAAKCHSKVPEAYYALASQYISDDSEMKRKMIEYYNLGMEAERNMLDCYLPYQGCDRKDLVESVLALQIAGSGGLERKSYFANPRRKEIIISHRQTLRGLTKNNVNFGTPKLTQPLVTRTAQMKPLTLKEMGIDVASKVRIFENRIVDLTIVDDPYFFGVSIQLVVEDENGDTTFLHIYNIDKTNEYFVKRLEFGCRIGIMNPCLEVGAKPILNRIRNDNPECILFLKGVDKMCRLCAIENAYHLCSSCRRARYCSIECQIYDKEEMLHSLICGDNVDNTVAFPQSN